MSSNKAVVERQMEVTQTSADGLKREFKIVVDAKDIETRIDSRLSELRKTANIPGFRPGKVPVSLLRQRYGDSLRGEILEQAVNQTSSQAMAEQNLRPAVQPRIQVVKFDDGDDLEYTMELEVLPDIVPGDFDDIELTSLVPEIPDAGVDEAIDRLATSQKNFVTVEKSRKSKKGDALKIDFVGSVDGVEFEGGTATDHVLELGSSSFIDGFEEQLIGAKPGDHIAVKLAFPEAYMNEELAGKDAVFEVDVKEIQETAAVTIDDEFAKGHGFDNLAAMRETVTKQMTDDYAGLARSRLKRSLLDVLSDRYDFPVPEGMVEAEFEAIWKRVEEDRTKNEADPTDVGRDDDELRVEYRIIAERRVRLGLLLSEVGQINNVTVEQDEIGRAVMERARAFPGQEEMVVNFYRENPEAMAELRAPLFEEKVVDLILEKTKMTEQSISIEELVRDPDTEPAEDTAKKKKKSAAKKKAAPKRAPAKKAAAKKPAAKKKPAKKKTD
jgi:trigger factor